MSTTDAVVNTEREGTAAADVRSDAQYAAGTVQDRRS